MGNADDLTFLQSKSAAGTPTESMLGEWAEAWCRSELEPIRVCH